MDEVLRSAGSCKYLHCTLGIMTRSTGVSPPSRIGRIADGILAGRQKFCAEHLSGGSPAVALRAAQMWSRRVTAAELAVYFRDLRARAGTPSSSAGLSQAWRRFVVTPANERSFSHPLLGGLCAIRADAPKRGSMIDTRENLSFLDEVACNLQRLEVLLGADWPFFRQHLLSIELRIAAETTPEEISAAVDDMLDLLLETPAGDLVKEILKHARADSATNEVTRTSARHPKAVPESADEVYVDQSPDSGVASKDPTEAVSVTVAKTLSLLGGPAKEGYVVVPVYYGTDRARALRGFYSGQRGSLEFGIANVSVPANRPTGSLPRPKWWKLQFEDLSRHIVVLDTQVLAQEDFCTQFRSVVGSATEPAILVFVHGYNVTFVDAARRAAQLAVDLDYPGIPFLYSWPSVGRTLGYTHDETNITWTVPHLKQTLTMLSSSVGATAIDIISHSMGNRAMVEALCGITVHQALRHVVMAAPDIDAGTFRELSAAFHGRAKSYTLYASSRDRALWFSKLMHGYPRAGESGEGLVVVPEAFDTVDSTCLDTSLLGHSYYGDNRSIVGDIFALLQHGSPPPRFGMSAMSQAGSPYWLLR